MSEQPVTFIAEYAARKGLRYRPDADERWLRAWEPYTTLRTPLRYEHTVEATGLEASFTVARLVVTMPPALPGAREGEASAWVAIAQDPRIELAAAGTSEPGQVFGEPLDLIPMPRRRTGDDRFDRMYATFAPAQDTLPRAITPSLRKLLAGWRLPLHFELRPGGFVLAPVGLPFDAESLGWLVRSLPLFAEKAVKVRPPGEPAGG